MNFKRTIVNNETVFMNPIVRFIDGIYNFIYMNLIPYAFCYKLVHAWLEIEYAFERVFKGYDRRISWGYKSSIKFYKSLLSTLIKNTNGCPNELDKVCPQEWNEIIIYKWTHAYTLSKDISQMDQLEISKLINDELIPDCEKEFENDCHECWLAYLERVLHYFNEADVETSSEQNEDYRIEQLRLGMAEIAKNIVVMKED